MAVLSSWEIWLIPTVLAAAAICFFGGRHGRAMILVLGGVLAAMDGGVVQFLKEKVQRPRPHEVMADVRQVRLKRTDPAILGLFYPAKATLSRPESDDPGGRAFPSAHTANNLCAAIVITFFYRRRGWLAFIPALAVGYSRIYTGSHWPSDVLISLLLAIGLTLPMLALLEWGWRRWAVRRWPEYPSLFDLR